MEDAFEAECEVVSVGTVQGHQWGWQDPLPNPLFRVLVILKNDLQGGVAQVGGNHFAPNILKPSYFVSFR